MASAESSSPPTTAAAPNRSTTRPSPSARSFREDFRVTLPDVVRPLPEPLPPGAAPGFAIRGTKGWMWRPEQYVAEIPTLVRLRMNFLMNCYTSLCDVEHFRWGDPRVNRWWEELPEAKRRAYEGVVRACQQHDIAFCFSMNPSLCTRRPLRYDSAEDVDRLWSHYAWMQGLGVKWFNVSLDDIAQGIDASGHVRVVNELYRRLRAADPAARMIFCPTYYWGDGTNAAHAAYLATLARELHEDVYVFWTGDGVVGPITRRAAESYRRAVRHRLFLWDNYPVNDAQPTLHLGPVVDRDLDLCTVIDGYMSNPLCPQNEINRIPLSTCADYAFNPAAYDPARSIGQAIVHLADARPAQEALRDLVEAYPGMLIYGRTQTSFNAVREQYARIAAGPHMRAAARAYIEYLERLARRLRDAFPDRFAAACATLEDDIALLKRKFAEQYGP